MQNLVLGMQGTCANGNENTFDRQAMHSGIHLRWSFTPELSFPPDGFSAVRRIVQPGEQQIPLPGMTQWTLTAMNRVVVTIRPDPSSNPCLANLQLVYSSFIIRGRAVPGQANVTLAALVKNQVGKFAEICSYTVPIVNGLFGAQIIDNKIDTLYRAYVLGVEQFLCSAAD
jgi:hypothetical protein